MLASRVMRLGTLQNAVCVRSTAGIQTRSLHISPQFRPAAALTRVRQSNAVRPISLTTVRFNSTTTSAAAAAAPLSSPTTTDAAPFLANLDNFDTSTVIQHAPETMGYLRSLGIDSGWGTTNIIQTLFEGVHVYSGLPWWGTILTTVVLVRLAQFPGYCQMSSTAARMKEIQPVVTPVMEKMKAAQARNDMPEMMKYRSEMSQMYQVSGINRWWLIFPFTQIPVFYGFYKILRSMAEVPVPALLDGGIAWFSDLSVADPTLIIPTTASLLIGFQIYKGGEAGSTTMAKSMKNVLAFGLPLVSFAFTYSWPAALGFYIMCNSAIGVAQTFILKNETVREKLGLYPMALEGTANPLASKTPTRYSALNIVRPAVEESQVIDATPKQIGGPGSWLDKFTGGTGEKGWNVLKLKETASEKQKEATHKEYETRRKKRLAEQKKLAQLERERKQRMRQAPKP
ncbi:60Kd inner membrane protein-domain-containing protein [Tricharina praecox]|uniref:60Kd inner membrane protein-domain-containing protein n=1 Tax=Tricharina praecox TaxID=43433 RepID=UPI00221EE4A3|nr:60Kd inner membrane protein-domain-containing protein [Tricharina praecox]KAI5844145.1 60Kd inner membrane protein-domain-containing protein [Tricharina praecox]